MDSSINLPTSTMTENSMDALSPRARFFSTYNPHQNWSLPDSIIYYILKNPSTPKVYQKLIQTCKYFFIENPILIVPSLIHRYENNQWNTWFNGNEVNLGNLTSMIWITDRLYLDNSAATETGNNYVKNFISRIYKCDAKEIYIWNLNLSFNDIFLLSSKCEIIQLNKVTVVEKDGTTVVELEKLFASFANVKDFYYDFGDQGSKIITSKTVKELLQLPNFTNLTEILWMNIPENLDINSFYGFIKRNKKTKIYLDFSNQISEEYKTCLQKIVNEIVAAENHKFKVPFIYFPGNDHTAFVKLRNLYSLN